MPDVFLFRRHAPKCPQFKKGRKGTKCNCPVWRDQCVRWSPFPRVNDRDKNVTVLDKDREKLLDDCIKDFYRPHAEIRVAD
jgi:hypothetical protein